MKVLLVLEKNCHPDSFVLLKISRSKANIVSPGASHPLLAPCLEGLGKFSHLWEFFHTVVKLSQLLLENFHLHMCENFHKNVKISQQQENFTNATNLNETHNRQIVQKATKYCHTHFVAFAQIARKRRK